MPSPGFQLAVSRTLDLEQGYTNHPSDPGGATNMGITERTARRNGYQGDMRFLPPQTAISIYEAEYWTPIQGDNIPFPIAYQLFDFGVNSGPIQAVKELQRLLKLQDDGIFGPKTLEKALLAPLPRTAFSLLRARMDFQRKLPTWPAFGKGWTDRNFQNVEYLLEDLHVF